MLYVLQANVRHKRLEICCPIWSLRRVVIRNEVWLLGLWVTYKISDFIGFFGLLENQQKQRIPDIIAIFIQHARE